MIGVNQVIMLALNMVIISSMIGAGGLGYDVLLALRALKIGQAMEAGLAIVIMAVVLDRLSQAMAHKRPEAVIAVGFWARHTNTILAIGVLVVTTLLGTVFPALNKLPDSLTFTTAPYWKAGVDWITVNFFDAIETMRVFVLLNFLNPLRAGFEALPWFGVLLVLTAAGLASRRLGAGPGRRCPHRVLCNNRTVGSGNADALSLRRFRPCGFSPRHPDRPLVFAQRPGFGHRHADHRYAADDPVILFHHSRRHAFPRGRCDGDDRNRRILHRAGRTLHQSRHQAGAA